VLCAVQNETESGSVRFCGGVAACLGVACVLCAVQNETESGSVRLCGGVAACLGVACVLCAVQNETESGSVFFFLVTKSKTETRRSVICVNFKPFQV
jgi:hypothetical protein